MRRKFFTEEEMSILRKNLYTYKITPRHIYFTAEFKKEFLRLYNENNTIKDCVRLLGFDPDILGNARINSLRRSFLKQLAMNGEFKSGPSRSGNTPTDIQGTDSSDEISRLKQRIVYLESGFEFLKKMLLLPTEKK